MNKEFFKLNKISLIDSFIIIAFFLVASSCSTKKIAFQTECYSIQTSGYFTVSIWNPSKGLSYKLKDARKDAVKSLLYSGLSGSDNCQTQPKFLKSFDEEENFSKIQKEFFSKRGDWTKFTRSSSLSGPSPKSIENQNWKVYNIEIAKQDLRVYLEKREVIKSLSNGF
jgi:hypothetical protein